MQKLLECKKFLGFGFVACVILIALMIDGAMAESDRYPIFLATYLVAMLGLWKDKNKLFTIIGLFLWGFLMVGLFLWLFGYNTNVVVRCFFAFIILYPVALTGLLLKKKRYKLLSKMYFRIFSCMTLIMMLIAIYDAYS